MSPFRIVAVLALLAALATAELTTRAADSADALGDIARVATTAFHRAQRDANEHRSEFASDDHGQFAISEDHPPLPHDLGSDTDDGGMDRLGDPDSDDGGPDSDDGGPDSDDGGPDSDDGGPDSDDGGPDSDDGGPDSDDGGLAEMQPAALTLTAGTELATAMDRLGDELAQRDELMQRLALCDDGDGAKDGVVVCALARAVHVVLMHLPRNHSDEGRPAALAALLRWDSLGVVSGPSGRRVGAADVRGVSLLLGRPGPGAVAGIAAFAFRALETCAGGALEAGAAGEPAGVANWSRLQRTADAAGDALSVPAARCMLLLFGSMKDNYDAARAAAAAAEVALCRFAVRSHAALRALGALREDSPFHRSVQNAAKELIERDAVLVGPVMGDGRAAGRAAGSPAAAAELRFAADLVSTLLSAGLRAHDIVRAVPNQRSEYFEELLTADHYSPTDELHHMLMSNDEAGYADQLLHSSAEAAAAEQQAERMRELLGAGVQIGAFEQQVARERQGPLEWMHEEDREVGSRLLAIFGGDVQLLPGAAAEPTAEPAENEIVLVKLALENEQLRRRIPSRFADGEPELPSSQVEATVHEGAAVRDPRLKLLMYRLKLLMDYSSARIEDERQWRNFLESTLDPTSGSPQKGGQSGKSKKLRVPKGNRLLGLQ